MSDDVVSPRMSPWRWAVPVGGVVFFILLNVLTLPRKYATHVDAEQVLRQSLPLIVRAAGNLDAKASTTVKVPFDGTLLEKDFREGDRVKKGQLLAVLNRDKIRLDYQSKDDAFHNADADLSRARKDLRLQKALYSKQAVAYSSVEDAERTLLHAEQALQAAKEAFRLELVLWNQDHVVSPFSGTVVKDGLGDDKELTLGKDLATVSDVSEYTVHARVDELDSKRITEKQAADVRLQIYDTPLKATVTQIGTALSGNGLTEVPVTLKLISTGGLDLRPKLTAEVRIHTGATEPVLSIPLTAVSNADGQPKVWLIDGVHRLRAKRVTLGRTNPDRAEVTQGLLEGAWVCKTAEPDFVEGMLVLVDAKPSTVSKTNLLLHKKQAEESSPPARKPNATHTPPDPDSIP